MTALRVVESTMLTEDENGGVFVDDDDDHDDDDGSGNDAVVTLQHWSVENRFCRH